MCTDIVNEDSDEEDCVDGYEDEIEVIDSGSNFNMLLSLKEMAAIVF
jgi:hypothetical protein